MPIHEDVEVSKGIVVNPGRMGGEPCIKGTRIPADMIGRMLDASDGPAVSEAWIIENYSSLSYQDIVNAKVWYRRKTLKGE